LIEQYPVPLTNHTYQQDTIAQTTEKVKARHAFQRVEAFESRFTSPRLPNTVLPSGQKDRPRKRATLYTTPLDSSAPMARGIGVFGDQEQQGDEDLIDEQNKEAEVELGGLQDEDLQEEDEQEEDEVSTAAQGLPC
jgi:hypothetical protein